MPHYRVQIERTEVFQVEIEADDWDAANKKAAFVEIASLTPVSSREEVTFVMRISAPGAS